MAVTRRSALRGVGALGLVAAAPTVLMGVGSSPRTAFPVGSILDATGPINIYGLPMIDSTRFAIDDINANGGVLGRPLRLIELDAQSNNQLYTEYASKLILENEVPVLMGGITSASREAMRPVVNRYQALYFYNEQYEGGVCDKFVFCTGVTPAQQLGVLVPWAVENHGAEVLHAGRRLQLRAHLRRLGQSLPGQGRRKRARPGVHPARRGRFQLGHPTHRAESTRTW